ITSSWTFAFAADGETRTRSLAEVRALRSHADRDVRRRAQAAVLERHAGNAQVLNYITNTIFQDHGIEIGLRSYPNVLAPTRLDDVSTIAHELGHGVHFVLAGRRQTPLNYWPTTPMAETASVFGEMVLVRNLLAGEKDPATRRQLLASRIEDSIATIFRQVAYTRYELHAHKRRQAGVTPA